MTPACRCWLAIPALWAVGCSHGPDEDGDSAVSLNPVLTLSGAAGGGTVADETGLDVTTIAGTDPGETTVADTGVGETTVDATGVGETPAGETGSGESSTGEPPPLPPVVECTTPFQYEGLQGCETTVEGVQVKYFPLALDLPVEHLAVYFHGDTAAEWYENWAFPEIVEWALPRKILVVAPLSPLVADNGPTYGQATPVEAAAVVVALEGFADASGAPHEKILYWSASGGSWWTTQSYIPSNGGRMPGYFAINCGGAGDSQYPFLWDFMDPSLRSRITMLFNYGSEDFLAQSSGEAFNDYQAMGFDVTQIVYPGAKHCDHPIAEPTIEFWSKFLP